MSSILEGLMGQLEGSALEGLSRQLGADRKQTQAGVAAALPMLLGALSRNSQDSSGAESLGAALDRDHDGSILDNVGGFLGQGDTSVGAGILKHVLGSKRNRVASGVSQTSGLDSASAAKMLALLAPVVLGSLGKAKRQGNMNSSALAGMLGQERQDLETKAPAEFGIMNKLLDADGDGDIDLGDLAKGAGLLGKLFG
jgi:hypothetical protein